MKRTLLAFALLAAGSAFGQVSLVIRIGAPPPVRVERFHSAAPGPDYNWIDGYWFADGSRWKWHNGYWTRPPYAGASWVAPRHDGERFFPGQWDGDHGRVDHDHHWDRSRERDDDRH